MGQDYEDLSIDAKFIAASNLVVASQIMDLMKVQQGENIEGVPGVHKSIGDSKRLFNDILRDCFNLSEYKP